MSAGEERNEKGGMRFLNPQLVEHADKLLARNRRVYERIKAMEQEELDAQRKLLLLKFAAHVAAYNHMGRFADPELEHRVCSLMQHPQRQRERRRRTAENQRRILHVMTAAGRGGGHTRAVANWVHSCIEDHHCIAITEQKGDVPEWLIKQVDANNGGEIRLLAEGTILEKAQELASMAVSYDLLVLHTHMFDIVPLLAFSGDDFDVPVVIYNTSDYTFWVGASVADSVLDISRRARQLCYTRRTMAPSEVLPVPLAFDKQELNKDECRARLGLPSSGFVIVTSGASYKYDKLGSLDFGEFAIRLVRQTGANVIVLGPEPTEASWKQTIRRSGGKVRVEGFVTKDEFGFYLQAADAYVDSFPVGSGTATVQALAADIRVFALDVPLNHFDALTENGMLYQDVDSMLDGIQAYLEKSCEREGPVELQRMVEQHSGEIWRQTCLDLLMPVQVRRIRKEELRDDDVIDERDRFLALVHAGNGYIWDPEIFSELRTMQRFVIAGSLIRNIMWNRPRFLWKLVCYTLFGRRLRDAVPVGRRLLDTVKNIRG